MSGLEAVGVAASIIQVADLSATLSVKLFSFYRQVKSASESLQLLSNEIALVSTTLRELSDNLKNEEATKLCSEHAFYTLSLVLDQCRDVLRQIQKVVDNNDQAGRNRFQQTASKIRIAFQESNVDQLRTKLERLKSTMLLVLNVIMYAGHIRSNNVPSLVQEQVDLMQSLLEDGQINNPKPRQFDRTGNSPRGLSTMIEPKGLADDRKNDFSHQTNDSIADQSPLEKKSSDPSIDYPEGSDNEAGFHALRSREGNATAEFKQYQRLIEVIFKEIDLYKRYLDRHRHLRIKDGVLNIHSGEIMRFQIEHGLSVEIDRSLFLEQKPETSSFFAQRASSDASQSSDSIALPSSVVSEIDLSIPSRVTSTSRSRSVSRGRTSEAKRTFPMSPRRKSHGGRSTLTGTRQDSYVSSRKRRSTSKDQASVSFDPTEEQAERQRLLDRRNGKSRESFRDQLAQLIDREENESIRRGTEHHDRDRYRKEREDEERRIDADKEEEWWAVPTIGGAAAAAAGALGPSRSLEEDTTPATMQQDIERSERRRERKRKSGTAQGHHNEPESGNELHDSGMFGQHVDALSLPGTLEDLLAQWTTLDKREIQRGQISAF